MSTTYNEADPYAGSRETTEGRVYTVTGGDWDLTFADPHGEERLVVNMGPQHPPPTASCGWCSTSRARR
ncbi:hypothetical protein [Blastococcus brunescens]|uniref:Uncharacterized protein n=1 Tax=Blastococcus brunescens TaxID=1564165 RepID=A0ABZ1B094_9ACTN|nr:hypothetical protein [Blastococcus sp. BMG 8361]WRL63143.1 hypothetical protein U6N30_25590 [Blastococcus sp. BMG 8361]